MTEPDVEPARRLHARAVHASSRGRYAEASRLARRGLALAPADSEVRARMLLTLALAEAEQARVQSSLALLDEAESCAADHPAIIGLTHGQRGVLLLRLGQLLPARRSLSTAISLLADQPIDQARALLNRGVAELDSRDLAAAQVSFRRSAALADSVGLTTLGAKAMSNLGLLAGLRGDLAVALTLFQDAMERFGDEEPILRAVTVVDSAFVLTSAGLLAEAEAELQVAADVLGAAHLRFTEADAWLSLAEIALVEDRYDDAQTYSRKAVRGFRRRGSTLGVMLAEASVLASASPSGRLRAGQLTATTELAGQLRQAGLHEEAARLQLRVARRLARQGQTRRAADIVATLPQVTSSRALQTRMLARTVRAELAQASGDHRGALREARSGLTDLQRRQSRLGSFDLQTSVVRHGADLARIGLADAVAGGRPAHVLSWLERTRALATRLPPVRPPEDPRMADLLETLRHLRLDLRQQELDPDFDPHELARLRAACRELERAAAARERQLTGTGDVAAEATLDQVRQGLAEGAGDPGAMVAIFDLDDRIHALVVTDERALVQTLGPLAPVEARLRRARADLDVLALSSTPPLMRSVVTAALHSSLEVLDELLWQPLAGAGREGPLALVPTGALATLPWTLLPGLRGRPITVARAPGAWLRGRSRAWPRVGDENPSRRVVFTTGPRVDRAEEEVTSAAAAWHGADVLTLPDPAKFLAAVSVATLLHVAAHGSHDSDNPLFSSIELDGGLVFGHDLVRVHPMPRHVVLSACDLGLSTVRSGGETLGMTAALLHGGAGSVVAGVARVADDIACDVAVAYHQRLAGGDQPSYALAGALADTGADGSGDQLAPLTCFGAGW